MKELGMTHEYIEVKDGNHIKPAITQLPAIFEFFATHTNVVPSNEEASESDD